MIKWDDQSSFRGLFSMEWYVLGNGPWDYTAVNPPGVPKRNKNPANNVNGSIVSEGSNGRGNVSIFGKEYSTYPDTIVPNTVQQTVGRGGRGEATAAAGSGTSSAGSGLLQQEQQYDQQYNYIQTEADSAQRSLFKGQLDGHKFAPQRTGRCSRGSYPCE